MTSSIVNVIGVGITPFTKPGSRDWDYPQLGKVAAQNALNDSKLKYNNIDAVVASYCYGEPTCGQRVVYELGLTGIPVFNVNNNCSSGSSALMLARHLVQSGTYHCVLAVGFERMERGLSERFPEKESPVKRHFDHMVSLGAQPDIIPGSNKMTSEVVKLYAYAANEYMTRYPDATREDFAKVAFKNRIHGSMNKNACFYGKPLKSEAAALKNVIYDPITVHQSSLTADGGAAAIVCSSSFIDSVDVTVKHRAVQIIAQRMCTDLKSSFDNSFIDLSGYKMAKRAAEACYRDANIGPSDVDVIEVHDCFAPNEVAMYEALGLCGEGEGFKLVRNGTWKETKLNGKLFWLNNRWVVNPSGGLEAKGHPIGATGLAQCYELVNQLRGECDLRQVNNAKVALQHNFGIGGATVITIYQKQNGLKSKL